MLVHLRLVGLLKPFGNISMDVTISVIGVSVTMQTFVPFGVHSALACPFCDMPIMQGQSCLLNQFLVLDKMIAQAIKLGFQFY